MIYETQPLFSHNKIIVLFELFKYRYSIEFVNIDILQFYYKKYNFSLYFKKSLKCAKIDGNHNIKNHRNQILLHQIVIIKI